MVKNINFKNSTKLFLILLILVPVFASFLVKTLVWDNPNNKWVIEDLYYKAKLSDKLTLAPIINQNINSLYEVNDASKLNSILVSKVATPKSNKDIINEVLEAKKTNKKISISGARHSMGGQVAYKDSIHLDMTKYDKISYESSDNSVTVESGATWKQIQVELAKQNRAVRVMQDSNIFTVGGSIGSNVHGKDVRYGSLIESINWLKIVNADGIEEKITPASGLFNYVLGGFGMFGVVTEVNLKTDPDTIYKYNVANIGIKDFYKKFIDLSNDPKVEQLEAQVSVSNDNLLKDTQVYYFEKTEEKSSDINRDVSGENSIWLRKLVYRISRESDLGKNFRWWMQANIGPSLDPKFVSRNGAMAAPFRTLQLEDEKTTDILQEYFIPIEKSADFINFYRETLQKNNINIVNCTIRKTNKDTQAVVSYGKSEMLGFVCYYKIDKADTGKQQMQKLHKEIGKWLVENQGTFYLTYQNYFEDDVLFKIYPELNKLFVEKTKYDPDEVFYSQWYENVKNKRDNLQG